MQLLTPQLPLTFTPDKKYASLFEGFSQLIRVLGERSIPSASVTFINGEITNLQATSGNPKNWGRMLRKTQTAVLLHLEKELKLVTKDHHRKKWLALGMGAFGVPIGVAFGLAIRNLAFLGLGLPIGMSIGLAVGSVLDKKAAEAGQQLPVVVR